MSDKPSTYEQFDKHFAKVSAWAILRNGEYVARAACKYPADGMGRCYFYLQVWGAPMARGTAGGCGYDKTTAAAYAAARNLQSVGKEYAGRCEASRHETIAALTAAICGDDAHGERWTRRLESAGFTVLALPGCPGWRDAYSAGLAAGRHPGALLPSLPAWAAGQPLHRAARAAGFEAGRIERGIGCYPVRLADLTGRHGTQFWAVAPGLFQATQAGQPPAMNGAGYPDLESIWKLKGC